MARLLMEEAMPNLNPVEIARTLADTLPPSALRRDEIIAVGILATALISGIIDAEERANTVEKFCSQIRANVANELN